MASDTHTQRIRIMRLTRSKTGQQTLGQLFVHHKYTKLFECVCLERWNGIPAGDYFCVKYQSPSLKREVLLLEDVPGHTYIEIHNGNRYTHTKLCILTGEYFTDMDKDGLQDVTDSNATLDKLIAMFPGDKKIKLQIFE